MIAVVICVAVIAALGAGFAVGVRFARVRRDKDEAFGAPLLHLQTCTEASHERRLIIGNRSRGQTMRTTREASPWDR